MPQSMTRTMTFGDLQIAYDEGVLTPRPWTTVQATWAAELLAGDPPGPVLELGCGAGQIGLLALSRTHRDSAVGAARRLVCVDSSATACSFARRNAEAAGLTDLVEVRERDLGAAADAGERFALILADPPWVPSGETGRHPEDPPSAIDGGPDGLDVAREWLAASTPHLVPGGSILLQLGSREQLARLAEELVELEVAEVRDGEGGVAARLTAVASGGG